MGLFLKAGMLWGGMLAGALAVVSPGPARADVPWHPAPPGTTVKNLPFPRDDGAFVSMAYSRVLGRSPRKKEAAKWEGGLRSGEVKRDMVLSALFASDEFFVRRLFLDLLGRPPGREELKTRLGHLRGGGRRRAVYRNLLNSEEYRSTLR
jgi:hypothetical protein